MDYKKIQYEQKKLAKKNAHHHAKETKEIRFTPNTGDHDISIKAKHIKEFLTGGHKVRLTVKFRGREGKHTELGVEVINKAFDHIGRDIFNIDQPINMDSGTLGATISAKKV
jgi:translation initiation factor IF-3